MKRFFYIAAMLWCTFFTSSCSIKCYPYQSEYLSEPYTISTDKSFDEIWDNLIDFFSQKGLPITLLDKESGLLISSKAALTWTFENSDGELKDADAWVVIQKCIDPGPRRALTPSKVVGDWNVRIKENEKGKAVINVNLVNIEADGYVHVYKNRYNYDLNGKTTGNFEKSISNIIKDYN